MRRSLKHFLVLAILIALNVLVAPLSTQFDLTEDKRYSLTAATKEMLGNLQDRVFIDVLLTGNLPAGFKRLRRETEEMLIEFRQLNGRIDYQFSDPQSGIPDEINARSQRLAERGVIPTRLRVRDRGEATERLIYPYAIINYGEEQLVVNLLENEQPGVDNEVVLNNSIALLEYKLASGLNKILEDRRKNIIITTGHGELEPIQTRYLESELHKYYNTARVNLDSVIFLPDEIDLVIIAKPRSAFSDKELFVLDQYVMGGGNLMVCLDLLDIALDSLGQDGSYIPLPLDLNLDPLFFKYGARIQPNLVLDLECTRIPLVVGQIGDRVQTELFPWYYHPVVQPASEHPVVKGIDRVNMLFPASIDTLRTAHNVRKSVLLASSDYTRVQRTPVRLNFEILRYEPEPERFDLDPQALAVLIEGAQESAFSNRVSDAMLERLRQAGVGFKANGAPSKLLIVSDGDVLKNLFNPQTGEIRELGYNKYENFVFNGNQSFVFNAIEYMLDESGVSIARGKEIKLRRLDVVKAQAERSKWQFVNVILPLVLLLAGVGIFSYVRRKRFASR